jgi:endonuclease III
MISHLDVHIHRIAQSLELGKRARDAQVVQDVFGLGLHDRQLG